jgi:FG-GAP-like repeat
MAILRSSRLRRPWARRSRPWSPLEIVGLERRVLLSIDPPLDVRPSDPAQAPLLDLVSNGSTTLYGILKSPGDFNLFEIGPSTTGRLTASVQLTPSVQATKGWTRLSLLDDEKRVVVQSEGQSSRNNQDLIVQHLVAGTYYVKVEDLTGDVGAYALTGDFEVDDPRLLLGDNPITVEQSSGFISFPSIGDLNGDGIPDLVSANRDSNTVSVLLGNGDGTFRPPTNFTTGGSPQSVALGDVNGDGRPDLVTANNYSGDVSVLLGNGDGTFRPQARFAAGPDPQSVALVDVNGDGRLDLVTANGGFEDVSVLLGNGDGTFRPQARFAAGPDPQSVAVGDVNGDGRPDLVTANYLPNDVSVLLGNVNDSDAVSVLLGNGDGTFRPPTNFAVAAGRFPNSVALVDVNGDGRLDLVTANGFDDLSVPLGNVNDSDAVSVLLGNGDGAFRPPTNFAAGRSPDTMALGDVNGDGRLDLITANGDPNAVSVLLGNGDGTFRPPTNFATGGSPDTVALVDVNGDGRLDLVMANDSSDAVSVLLGNGDGTFRPQARFTAGRSPQSVAVGDVNGDGRPDLVTANLYSDDVSVLLSNGDGTFRPQARFAAGRSPDSVALGDVNGDGRPDLVTANFGSDNVSVLLGNGDGTFRPPTNFAAGRSPQAGRSPDTVALGDVNGDGRLDLVTANYYSDDVSVLLGNGDGTFRPPTNFAAGSNPDTVALGDVNGDGRLDLVTANFGSGPVSVLLGNGDGTFRPQARFAADFSSNSVALGDVNGDGRPDLVTTNWLSSAVSVLLGNGDGTFRPPTNFTVGVSPQSVALGDVNGDGRPDLVTANFGSDDVSVLLGNGDGTFRPQARFAAGQGPSSVALGDVNGDGRPDLVTANLFSDNVSVLLNLGSTTFAEPAQITASTRIKPRVADLDSDGIADVIVSDGAGDILWRRGRAAGTPGMYDYNPPVLVNPGTPARDFAIVPSVLGPLIATVDAKGNTVSFFVYSGGRFIKLGMSLLTGALPAQIEAADLDGNGSLDLVVRNAGSGTLSVFLGRGGGSFDAAPDVSVGLGVSDIVLADADGNGTIDILVTNKVSGIVGILPNRGNGTFEPMRPYHAGAGPYGYGLNRADGKASLTSFEATSGVVIDQFSPDGGPILVALNEGSNTLGVLNGLPGGGFANAKTILTQGSPQAAIVADFAGDGSRMLAVLMPDGVTIYRPNGAGGFRPTGTFDAGNGPAGLSTADVNGDKKLDLLIGNEFGDLLILLGNGDGTFQPYQRAGRNIALAVADLNGDGKEDFIFANQALDRVVVAYGGGQTTTRGDRSTGLLAPGAVKLADLNGDKIPDLIVANSGGEDVLVYLGLGDGRFGPALNNGHGFFAGTNPAGISVADVDGDGRPDLVVANWGSNDVSILLNKPQGKSITFAPGPRLKAGYGPVSTVVQDVTGDGIPDILVSNSQSNNVMLLPGRGQGSFDDRKPRIFPVGNSPGPVFIGNLDGRPDIVVAVNGGLTLISGFTDPNPVTRTIPLGGLDPVALFEFSFGNGFDNLVVGSDDGTFWLLEGGPDGLNLTSTETEPGLNPTDLAFLTITGGQVQFYAAYEIDGSEAAMLLTFQLGGEPGGMPTVFGLQPLRDEALPLIATLLTLTIETSTAEIDLGAISEEDAAAFSFLPVTGGQSLLDLASSDEGEGGDEEDPNEPQEPDLPVAQESSPWEPFFMGLDEALDQFCRDSLDQFLSRDELAPDQAQPLRAPSEPLGRWQRDPASPEERGPVGADPNPLLEANQGQIIDEVIYSLWADESRPVRTDLTSTSGPLTSDGPLPAEIAPGAATVLSTEPVQEPDGPFLSSSERGFGLVTEFAVSLVIAACIAGRVDPPSTRQCTHTRFEGLYRDRPAFRPRGSEAQ